MRIKNDALCLPVLHNIIIKCFLYKLTNINYYSAGIPHISIL